MKLNIKPLGSRVVVKPSETESITEGGIIIPDTAKEKPNKGTVVAVGNDKSLTVKVGDNVLYANYCGTEININDSDYIIMNETDIFSII